MKKQILLLMTIMVALYAPLFAQKARFGIQAGPTVSNMVIKFDNVKLNTDLKLGFTAGFLADIPLNDHFHFQPAVNFVQKGSLNHEDYHKSQATLNYIELPFNFIYRTQSVKGFFAGIGPSLGIGLSGQTKDEIETETIHFGNNEVEDDLKRMDFGGNIQIGYMFGNGIQVGINYNKTFSNLFIGENADDASLKNNYYSLRVGYLLKSKK